MTLNTNINQISPHIKRFSFEVTSVVWHEAGSKMECAKIQNSLNKISIGNYSDVVKEIYFTFMVLPDDFKPWHKSHSRYLSSTNSLLPVAWLHYEAFAKATPEEAMQMQAQAYLDTILTFPTIKGLKKNRFDHEKFYADVKNLFEQEGWINTNSN